jgi:hypothetical protein
MVADTKEIFIAYEHGHVDEARARAERGATVVCLDFWVERECKKKNIHSISVQGDLDGAVAEEAWYVLSHEVARGWYRLPAMRFFEYDGIRIAEAPEPTMESYLARLFYYARKYNFLKKTYPNAQFTIPVPVVDDAANAYCPASFIAVAAIDAARMAGLQFAILGTRLAPKAYAFPQASWKSLVMRAYNMLTGLAPRRGFKIYASEYWTYTAPVVPYLDDTELMLVERTKFTKIPWRHMLRHRIRFFYPHDAISGAERRAVAGVSEKYTEQWKAARGEVAAYLAGVQKEFDWSPVLEACEYLITYAPRVIADIRALQRIMKKEKPDIVLQMASVGGPQHYFFLMAKVAAQLGIPSVELQHAGATVDPRSVYSRIETKYLATYGADVNVWHERLGHAPERLIAAGSPRFDQYVNERARGVERGKQLFIKFGLDPARPVLLAAVPSSEAYVNSVDSYQLAEFFGAVRSAHRAVPGLQALFKFRGYNHIGAAREYLQELFPADCAIAGNEDIFSLLCASDAVVCHNSTVIYQAVLAQKPLVLYPWKRFDTYHAQMYSRAAPLSYTAGEAADGIARMFTDASYREELLTRQKRFLEQYSFDGKSSRRVAALLRDLARQSR